MRPSLLLWAMASHSPSWSPLHPLFIHQLPPSRLGQRHDSLESFRKASNFLPQSAKEYTLIVVTDTARKRILLGHKLRGFGTGMYNSFGGKIEHGESVDESARRELEEETGITLTLCEVAEARVGSLLFTFQDDPVEMVVHLFRIHVSIVSPRGQEIQSLSPPAPLPYPQVEASCIRGCDEITPHWFEDWHRIPLDNMFADDSVWLTQLLDSPVDLALHGWFHFAAGGAATNTILHFHVDSKPRIAKS